MSRLPRMLHLLGAVAIATVAALTGCSAGQVTQTSTQVATVNGSSADLGDLALRDIRILYPSGGTYAEGSTAQLVLVVTNQGLSDDTLIGVTGDAFDEARVRTGSDTDEPTESTESTESAATTAPTGPTRTDEATEAGVEVSVPAQGMLQFGTDEYPSIELVDLSEDISVAEILPLTFIFEEAGEITVEVPVANPVQEIDREEGFDFHTEEGE